jgi:general secretion pathway protein I
MIRRQRGFSLLEVIAAIMLLAIAFGALMKVVGSSFNLTAHASRRGEAALLARSKLETLGRMDPLQEGQSDGRFDDTYRWQVVVTRWGASQPDDDPSLRLYKLDLDVSWTENAKTSTAHFTTLRMPEVSPGPEQGDGP